MNEAPSIARGQPQKRIAIFLDGTWNSVSSNTNVWRLKSLCAPLASDGWRQITYYDVGVNGFWGGIFGKGVATNVINAYEWLVDQYEPGDDIFIFGFSRGAFTARSLAGFVAKCGLLKPGSPLGVGQLFARYKRENDKTIWTLNDELAKNPTGSTLLEEKWILKYAQPINVKMVAVWDTVGSLGVPLVRIPGIGRKSFSWHHTGLRTPIQYGYQALALDEYRKSFAPTLWTVRTPKVAPPSPSKERDLSSVEQRWFVGAHANVGGGYQSDLLAQIPLRWLMKKASTHGLQFRGDVELDGNATTSVVHNSHKEFMYGAYQLFSWPRRRNVGELPIERNDGTHSTVNETIDVSVFDRWRADAKYRPKSLKQWAKRHNADPADYMATVSAANPKISISD
jgi:uncharacterized protein (DUF2235 family)